MGDILVPYFNKQLPFLGFEDYSINGGGPPTDADQCLSRQFIDCSGSGSASAAAARDGDIYESPRTWQVSSHGWMAEEAGDLLAIKRTRRVRTKQLIL